MPDDDSAHKALSSKIGLPERYYNPILKYAPDNSFTAKLKEMSEHDTVFNAMLEEGIFILIEPEGTGNTFDVGAFLTKRGLFENFHSLSATAIHAIDLDKICRYCHPDDAEYERLSTTDWLLVGGLGDTFMEYASGVLYKRYKEERPTVLSLSDKASTILDSLDFVTRRNQRVEVITVPDGWEMDSPRESSLQRRDFFMNRERCDNDG